MAGSSATAGAVLQASCNALASMSKGRVGLMSQPARQTWSNLCKNGHRGMLWHARGPVQQETGSKPKHGYPSECTFLSNLKVLFSNAIAARTKAL